MPTKTNRYSLGTCLIGLFESHVDQSSDKYIRVRMRLHQCNLNVGYTNGRIYIMTFIKCVQ